MSANINHNDMDYNYIKKEADEACKRFSELKGSVSDCAAAAALYRGTEYADMTRWRDLERFHRPDVQTRRPFQSEVWNRVPIGEFIRACCENDILRSSDGPGFYGSENEVTDIEVTADEAVSAWKKGLVRPEWTHIWWYGPMT